MYSSDPNNAHRHTEKSVEHHCHDKQSEHLQQGASYTFHHMYVAALERQTIQCEHQLQEVQAVEPVTVPPPAKSVRSHPHRIFTPM